jgi:cation diffusion facilitator CzcD-associated flavoprotein CzcO
MPAIPGVEACGLPSPGALAYARISPATRRHHRHGATAIQAIPEIAKQAKQLTVFQRRPNWAAPLHNSKISRARCGNQVPLRRNYAHCASTPMGSSIRPTAQTLSCRRQREAFWENYTRSRARIWLGNFRDTFVDEKANAAQRFIARKIRQRVKNPAVAKLVGDHGFVARRAAGDGYFEAYNRDNVLLVDTLSDGRSSGSRRVAPDQQAGA